MRIVVNDIAASSGGALTVLKNLYNYIEDNDDQNEWFFLLGDKYIEETDNVKVLVLENVKKNWLNRLGFDFFWGRKFISSLKPDVVFSLQNTITFGLSCPQVVYMHQSIPFQKVKKFSFFKSEERKLAIYQYIIGSLIKQSIKKADKVIVQTKWIRDAVIDILNISPDHVINVFPNFENYIDRCEYEDYLFDMHSFFYPASKEIHKNHKCIYDANEILEQQEITDYKISITIENEKKIQNINYLGEISFSSVIEHYHKSTLIFPSYIETVGLPMLEARQVGTIILASDCPFSREVLDGYANAYFFNPFKPNELADLMKKVLKGEISKKTIDTQNKKKKNSWEIICGILVDLGGKRN